MAETCPECGYFDYSGLPFCLTCGMCAGCWPCNECNDSEIDDDDECYGCDKKGHDAEHCYACGLCDECQLEIMCENCAENKLTDED